MRPPLRVVMVGLSLAVTVGVSAPSTDSVSFSFVCAQEKESLPPELKSVVSELMAKHRDEGVVNWGDRAVTVPLRRDGVPTYFVPLSCGATGNCTWGIIAKSPVRSLGVVNGAIIFVSTRSREWPDVSVLSAAGAGDATMETLKFAGDGYQRSKVVKVDPGLAQKLGGCIDDESCCPRPAT